MGHSVAFQIVDYPGAQKSAQWGMKDLLDYANTQAENLRSSLFTTEIAPQPIGRPGVIVFPPALSSDPPKLPSGWQDRLVELHRPGTVLASVCSGAFLLAETGLLDGRRVTTHWRHSAVFHRTHPSAIIDTDRLLVDLGSIVTAGGVMAWTDLTLHMIERIAGRKLVLDVASTAKLSDLRSRPMPEPRTC
ncbi:DJ-1/PfpI family protein [Ruegeria arenilitoris]|uniref:DJ-1/PfpI family protein n=1 Tax=Ruegeria arenilitoris TaxID=1173585 RepID=UPI0014817F68